jgi:hypothetical protein
LDAKSPTKSQAKKKSPEPGQDQSAELFNCDRPDKKNPFVDSLSDSELAKDSIGLSALGRTSRTLQSKKKPKKSASKLNLFATDDCDRDRASPKPFLTKSKKSHNEEFKNPLSQLELSGEKIGRQTERMENRKNSKKEIIKYLKKNLEEQGDRSLGERFSDKARFLENLTNYSKFKNQEDQSQEFLASNCETRVDFPKSYRSQRGTLKTLAVPSHFQKKGQIANSQSP